MKKCLAPIVLATGVSLIALDVSAQSFSSFDPRSMAMGGVGVAVSRPDTATYFNPALLSLPREDDDFALQIPYVGAKVYDPDDYEDSITEIEDAVDALDATIDRLNNALNLSDFERLSTQTTDLNNALINIDEDLLLFDGGAGVAGGRPSEKLGIGVFVGGRLSFNGIFNYEDADDLTLLVQEADLVAGCIAVPATCTTVANQLEMINITAGTPQAPINVTINYDPDNDLQSTADIRGILITEAGISFSHYYNGFAIGVTPKYVKVETFDYQADVDDADTDDFDGSEWIETYSDFNLDLGIAKAINENVNVGLVIKNLIEQDYDTVQKDILSSSDYSSRGGAMTLSPQARAGISYQSDWWIVAADLDLTKNGGIGFEEDSQQLSVGAEFDALGFLQLRVGYKSDLEDSDRSNASAGIGIFFLGAHIDAAVAGNGDEMGGSFELGFSF